ncbi:MAG TPA: GNAT family N-acetyltransferase [Treponemataceae bacterium]|nr:GNAT family N-acetyltransferase [Treponemataceae bacterium]HQL04621.1 GNAT family N-acetyltransferase [Treponemataceae bacterium]
MEITQINASYVDDALKILKKKHDSLVSTNWLIPEFSEFPNLFDDVNELFSIGNGIVAVSNGRLMGFITGFPCPSFFGRSDGVYCPVYGIGLDSTVEPSQIIDIYSAAAELWISNKQFTHAVTIFSNEEEIKKSFSWQGFGLRCIDAVTSVKNIPVKDNDDIKIISSNSAEYEKAAEIHRLHNEYYRSSPIFMPNEDEDYVKEQEQWISKGNMEWLALRGNEIIGYIRLGKEGENYISCHESILNIKGMYVLDSERGRGIAKRLLDETMKYLYEKNYTLCGVDYESINPKGSHFWLTHFEPYTYSLVRRVDERIFDYLHT